MKDLSKNILSILQDEEMGEAMQKIVGSHGQNNVYDVTLQEAFEKFNELSVFLVEDINSGAFDEVPFNRRNNIYRHLNGLRQSITNPGQAIKIIEGLYEELLVCGVFYRRYGSSDFQKELRSLTKLKKSMIEIVKVSNEANENFRFIQIKKKELEGLLNQLEQAKSHLGESKEAAEENLQKSETALTDTNAIFEKVKQIQQQIEEKRLSITTFSGNIEEYKTNLSSLEERAKELLAQKDVVDGLIKDSREALKLGSARGISAAFSAQYAAANSNWLKIPWIIGGVVFLFLAAGFTAWAIGGWGIVNPDSLNSILGRVVAVAVSIAGAAFCAKQYVRQKNIIEDYAYKAALSKSIVAFTEEIGRTAQEGDGKQISTYLTKVLDEIHKDPLRPRRDSESRFPSKDTLDSIKKLLEVINQKVT